MEKNKSSYSKNVINIALSNDTSKFVSAFANNTLKTWNCETEQRYLTFRGGARSVAVSFDDRYVVSLFNDSSSSSIKVWNFSNGNELKKIDYDGTPTIVRFSSDGTKVIIGCKNDRVFIWDWNVVLGSLKEVILPMFGSVEMACDCNTIYTCSYNKNVFKIDIDSQQVSTVRRDLLRPVVVSPNGKAMIFVAFHQNIFHYHDLTTDYKKHDTGHPDDSIITAIDVTSDGKFALTGSSAGTLSLINLESSQKTTKIFPKTSNRVAIRFVCLLVLNDDALFVFVSEENKIVLGTFNDDDSGIKWDMQLDVQVTSIAAVGFNCVLLGCEDGTLLRLYLNDKSMQKRKADNHAISHVKSDPRLSSHRIVLGSVGGSVQLWNVQDKLKLIWSFDILSDPITTLAFVPCSDNIIVASGQKIHRINANEIVCTYEFDLGEIEALHVMESAENILLFGVARVITDSDHNRIVHHHKVLKWILTSDDLRGKEILTSFSEAALQVKNSSDLVGFSGDNSLFIWNFKSGKILRRLATNAAKNINALALVPGGAFLLSSWKEDTTLKLWNLQSGQLAEETHFERDVLDIACALNGMVCVGLKGGRVCFKRLNHERLKHV